MCVCVNIYIYILFIYIAPYEGRPEPHALPLYNQQRLLCGPHVGNVAETSPKTSQLEKRYGGVGGQVGLHNDDEQPQDLPAGIRQRVGGGVTESKKNTKKALILAHARRILYISN